MQRNIHYPGMPRHVHSHVEFAAKATFWLKAVKTTSGDIRPLAQAVMRFLMQWLTTHIDSADRAFANFLKEQGVDLSIITTEGCPDKRMSRRLARAGAGSDAASSVAPSATPAGTPAVPDAPGFPAAMVSADAALSDDFLLNPVVATAVAPVGTAVSPDKLAFASVFLASWVLWAAAALAALAPAACVGLAAAWGDVAVGPIAAAVVAVVSAVTAGVIVRVVITKTHVAGKRQAAATATMAWLQTRRLEVVRRIADAIGHLRMSDAAEIRTEAAELVAEIARWRRAVQGSSAAPARQPRGSPLASPRASQELVSGGLSSQSDRPAVLADDASDEAADDDRDPVLGPLTAMLAAFHDHQALIPPVLRAAIRRAALDAHQLTTVVSIEDELDEEDMDADTSLSPGQGPTATLAASSTTTDPWGLRGPRISPRTVVSTRSAASKSGGMQAAAANATGVALRTSDAVAVVFLKIQGLRNGPVGIPLPPAAVARRYRLVVGAVERAAAASGGLVLSATMEGAMLGYNTVTPTAIPARKAALGALSLCEHLAAELPVSTGLRQTSTTGLAGPSGILDGRDVLGRPQSSRSRGPVTTPWTKTPGLPLPTVVASSRPRTTIEMVQRCAVQFGIGVWVGPAAFGSVGTATLRTLEIVTPGPEIAARLAAVSLADGVGPLMSAASVGRDGRDLYEVITRPYGTVAVADAQPPSDVRHAPAAAVAGPATRVPWPVANTVNSARIGDDGAVTSARAVPSEGGVFRVAVAGAQQPSSMRGASALLVSNASGSFCPSSAHSAPLANAAPPPLLPVSRGTSAGPLSTPSARRREIAALASVDIFGADATTTGSRNGTKLSSAACSRAGTADLPAPAQQPLMTDSDAAVAGMVVVPPSTLRTASPLVDRVVPVTPGGVDSIASPGLDGSSPGMDARLGATVNAPVAQKGGWSASSLPRRTSPLLASVLTSGQKENAPVAVEAVTTNAAVGAPSCAPPPDRSPTFSDRSMSTVRGPQSLQLSHTYERARAAAASVITPVVVLVSRKDDQGAEDEWMYQLEKELRYTTGEAPEAVVTDAYRSLVDALCMCVPSSVVHRSMLRLTKALSAVTDPDPIADRMLTIASFYVAAATAMDAVEGFDHREEKADPVDDGLVPSFVVVDGIAVPTAVAAKPFPRAVGGPLVDYRPWGVVTVIGR
eukprot:TRINITY_DN62_c0_g3_i1.p1 TRINITY_DN62_c0_g3~~TRINITY_DN62_c0_g3_i1.p1  ORF type:complete len:1304 (-),score=154.26 TRINITY_DN62_c0_g3_i1:3599-7135(-)